MNSKKLFLGLSLVTTTGITCIETVNASGFAFYSERTDTSILIAQYAC